MVNRKYSYWMMAALIVALTRITALAEPVIVNISQLALILPEQGNPDTTLGARLLLKFDLPEQFQGQEIGSAWIEFDANLPVEGPDSTLVMAIHPISRSWNEEEVSWLNPWNTPGGDFIDTLGQTYFSQVGLFQHNRIDVTDYYRLCATDSLMDYGLIFQLVFAGDKGYRALGELPEGLRESMKLIIE